MHVWGMAWPLQLCSAGPGGMCDEGFAPSTQGRLLLRCDSEGHVMDTVPMFSARKHLFCPTARWHTRHVAAGSLRISFPTPEIHRRHARGRLRKRNARDEQPSRERFEMVRWLPDRPLLVPSPPHRPGGLLVFQPGSLPVGCWLLAPGCFGMLGSDCRNKLGVVPPLRARVPGEAARARKKTRAPGGLWNPPLWPGKCGSRPPPQPGSRIGTACSHSVRGASLIRARRPWLPDAIGGCVPGHGWGHNGRQMTIQISAAAQNAVRTVYEFILCSTTRHGRRRDTWEGQAGIAST